jgi:hypothetical protein
MSFGLGNASAGLPALLGVLLGIRAYTGGLYWILVCVALIAVGAGANWGGKAGLHRWPQTGAWLIEIWILATIGVAALATSFIVWIAVASPALFGNPSDPETKVISAAFVGAVTAYVALVWTKDISEAKGYFWPSTQFKDGMKQAYERLARKPKEGDTVFEAMFEDSVVGHGALGWDFSARKTRAKILSDFVSREPPV